MSRLVVAAILCFAVPALAADQVLPGKRLALDRTSSKSSAALKIQDPSLVLPAAGSTDDPSIVGLRLKLVATKPQFTAELFVPPGAGWTVKTGARTTWAWKNAAAPGGPSPVLKLKLVSGRRIELKARDAGLPLSGTQDAVGVRVEMGATRACTKFQGAAVRRDVPGQFVARNAPVPAFDTCSDENLLDPPVTVPCEESSPACTGVCADGGACGGSLGSCVCVAPGQPCGDSVPACNGECPDGETCSNTGGVPFTDCGCVPTGSVGCGEVYPTCGDGACPVGTSCYPTFFQCCGGAEIDGCGCFSEPPTPPCGGCPTGWTCSPSAPGFPSQCFPPFCDASHSSPVCGGSCGGAATCRGVSGACLCLESCSGGDGYPTCNGTCTTAGTRCTSANGECLCLDD